MEIDDGGIGEVVSKDGLKEKALWVWQQTLLLHKRAPETRVASSLSPIEIFTALFYGGVLDFNPALPLWPERDRLIISKGHGSICLYPILADLGFIERDSLLNICRSGSLLGAIPDPVIPGYETVNGSLGHGPGVACGIALALSKRRQKQSVIVVTGDAELHEGAVWEAVMFAGHNRLDNLVMIVDDNRCAMLDYTEKVLSVSPLLMKFEAFGWAAEEQDGHDVVSLSARLKELKHEGRGKPKVVIARTVKGHGVKALEESSLCHIMSLKPEEIDRAIRTRGTKI